MQRYYWLAVPFMILSIEYYRKCLRRFLNRNRNFRTRRKS